MRNIKQYYENGELSALPDWDDVDVVYTRMQARRLLRLRSDPTKIAGKIMCIAVFARAARYQDSNFDLEEFLDEYCECNKIDKDELLEEMREFYTELGCWHTNPIMILEALSAL